jgi:hypothetical protein
MSPTSENRKPMPNNLPLIPGIFKKASRARLKPGTALIIKSQG